MSYLTNKQYEYLMKNRPSNMTEEQISHLTFQQAFDLIAKIIEAKRNNKNYFSDPWDPDWGDDDVPGHTGG